MSFAMAITFGRMNGIKPLLRDSSNNDGRIFFRLTFSLKRGRTPTNPLRKLICASRLWTEKELLSR